MRTSAGNASRVFTLISLFALITLSFVAQSSAASTHLAARYAAHRREMLIRADDREGNQNDQNGGEGGSSPSPSVTPTSTSTSSSVSTSTSTSSISTSTTHSTSHESGPTTATTSSQTPTTTSTSSKTSTTSTSTSTSTSTTSSTPSSTSTSTTSSSTTSKSSTTVVANTLKITSTPLSTHTSSTLIIQTNLYGFTSSATTDASAETSTEAAASASKNSSFLKNTGAVAATFTVVGIVAVAGVSAGIMIWRKRRANEEQDIFDTEYKEYNAGGGHQRGDSGDHIVGGNDMSSMSGNGASFAGAQYGGGHNYGQQNYGHMDFGLPMPPTMGAQSNRSSTVSNHAGFGAYRQPAQNAPPAQSGMQSSGLRNETSWNPEDAYVEPAVGEDQSIYMVSSYHDSEDPFHDPRQERSVGSVGTAH